MAYKVTAALVVAHVGGKVQHFYVGDVIPSNIDTGSLDNLKALGFISEEEPPAGTPLSADETARAKAHEASAEKTPNPPREPEAPTSERPTESGPGSAKEKWLGYAAFHNVEVPADASKDDVIAAVTAAGH